MAHLWRCTGVHDIGSQDGIYAVGAALALWLACLVVYAHFIGPVRSGLHHLALAAPGVGCTLRHGFRDVGIREEQLGSAHQR